MALKLPRHIRSLIAVELFFEPVSLRLFLLQLRPACLRLFEVFPIGSKLLTQIFENWVVPIGSRETLNQSGDARGIACKFGQLMLPEHFNGTDDI